MVIIQMSGGLGNQMFQYALYLKLKKMGKEVRFDDVETYLLGNARPIQLSVFGIHYPQASKEECLEMTDHSKALKDWIRRRISGSRSYEYQEAGMAFDPQVFEKDPAYLMGCFQSEKYFADIADEVRAAYTLDETLIPDKFKQQAEEIEKQPCAISIHVRRGDYLAAKDVYGDICTDEYYDAAIRYFQERFPNAVFYLFTNDHAWADLFVNTRSFAKIIPVRGTEEYTGYLDMYLISKCRHHIIANSSFSWWGSWLGTAEDKEIVAPSVWLNNQPAEDIYTDRMVRFSPKGEGPIGAEGTEATH